MKDDTITEQAAKYNAVKSSELDHKMQKLCGSVFCVFVSLTDVRYVCVSVCVCQTPGNGMLVLNFKGVW